MIALELVVCAIRGKSICIGADNGKESALAHAAEPRKKHVFWHEGDRAFVQGEVADFDDCRAGKPCSDRIKQGFNDKHEHCVDTFDWDVCVCKSMEGNHEASPIRLGLFIAHSVCALDRTS